MDQDYDLVVIRSGPAGQKAAINASKLGKRVAVIERAGMVGGVEDPNRSFQSSLWIGPDASPYRDYLIGLTMPVLDRFAGALRCSLPARSDEDCHLYMCFALAILAFMLAGPRYLPGFLPSFANCMNESVITQRMIKLVCGGLYGQAV
jgi:hypothetical protein